MAYRIRRVFWRSPQDPIKDPNEYRVETTELMTEEEAVQLAKLLNHIDPKGTINAE